MVCWVSVMSGHAVRMEYVSRAPRPPLDVLVHDVYYLTGTPPYRRLTLPAAPAPLLIVNLGAPFHIRAGNAVAVRLDAGTRRERFAVVVESRSAGDRDKEKVLRKEIGARVFEAVNARPSAVLVLPAGTLPKTPSGKLRRAAAGEQLAESIKAAS